MVGVVASREPAAAAQWLAGLAGKLAGFDGAAESALAGPGAGCPAAGLGCCRGRCCAFCRVLHASRPSELRTAAKSAVYDCLVSAIMSA